MKITLSALRRWQLYIACRLGLAHKQKECHCFPVFLGQKRGKATVYVKPRYVLGDKSEQHVQRYRPKKVIGVKNMVFYFFAYIDSIDPLLLKFDCKLGVTTL